MFLIGKGRYASQTYPQTGGASGPPPPATPGTVQVIRYRVGPAAGVYDSVTPIPIGSIILATSVDNDPADDSSNSTFGGGTTIEVGTTANTSLLQDTTDNTADVANNYQSFSNILIDGGNIGTGFIRTTIAGAGGGSASVTVQYVAVPQS